MNIHMNQIDEQAACSLLRQAGFTASEVDRLRQLRRGYVEQEIRQALAESRRLAFVRWLVRTGRLTDQ